MILSKLECFTRKSLRFVALFLVVIFILVSFGKEPQDELDRVKIPHNNTASCFTECIGW